MGPPVDGSEKAGPDAGGAWFEAGMVCYRLCFSSSATGAVVKSFFKAERRVLKFSRLSTDLMCDKAVGFIIGCFLCLCEGVAGQRGPIGEKCPDVLVERFLSGSGGRQLSCFWEKPLLLHFWNTGCSSAEDYLLFIDSVEKNYRGRLEVLLVSYENSVLVEEFFRGVALSGDFRFQTVVADSALNNLFPHRTEPHDVWIDAGGVVKAITGHTQITGENLEKFIGGGRLCLLEKKRGDGPEIIFWAGAACCQPV